MDWLSARNRLTLLLVDISIYSDLPDQGESRSDGTDRSNGDGSGDATPSYFDLALISTYLA